MDDLLVRSPYVTQTDEYVEARYTYQNVLVHDSPTGVVAVPTSRDIAIRTEKKVPKLGVMIVGLGGNNGSPQNTFVPGVVQLAVRHGVFLGGDDFKSGQTKVKSVMVDFLVSAGVRPSSIVSYNHLGNNDGANLSQQEMFRSKEISKSSVVDDMVQSNTGLYP
eukprot:Polyplicarium_translucidae@DN2747_c0_g1_i1.p2